MRDTDAEHSVHPDSHHILGFPCDMPHKSYELHGHREDGRPFAIYLWKDEESLEAHSARKAEWEEVLYLAEVARSAAVKMHLTNYAKILERRL